jgi:peptide/nickel transport system permease protein
MTDTLLPSSTSSDSQLGESVRSAPGGVLRRLVAQPRGAASLAFIALLVLVAVFAPLIAPYSPIDQMSSILQPPGTDGHLLGTDDVGRDVLSRLIHGTRSSLAASGIAVGIALLLGFPIGLVGGYFGGWVDALVMRVVDTLLSFPAIILAIGIAAVLGPGLTNAMLAVGVVFAPSIARLIRAQILAVKEELYVDAARSFGAGGFHLTVRHLIPNAIQPVLVQSALLLAAALIAEASLSFLGLGVKPPNPSWGGMLARAYTFIRQEPYQMVTPGLAIAATAMAFNVLGDAIQTALDPRRHRS